MNNLLIGRFIPQKSFIHDLDPRTKLLGSFYLIGITFLANSWLSYGIMVIATLFMVSLSNINFKYFLNGLKPLIWLIIFTVLLQIFFIPSGHVIFDLGFWRLTTGGLQAGLFIFIRFMIIIFISTLFTLTTSPLLISSAVESILSPLSKIHFPVSEVALMMSIALRFIPTLVDEVQNIMDAQKARGSAFGEGGLIKQAKSLIPILIPLFVNVFKRADDLAMAMEARGYQENGVRTKYRILRFSKKDNLAIVFMVFLTMILIGLYMVKL